MGWGVNLSSNLELGNSTLRLAVVYGEGIQNYMNDAPADVGIRNNFTDPRRPIVGEVLPVLGVVAFIDINWSDAMSTSIGNSMVDIDNSDGQSDNAFKLGDYALANILFTPVKNFMFGPEIQYGRRKNFRKTSPSRPWISTPSSVQSASTPKISRPWRRRWRTPAGIR